MKTTIKLLVCCVLLQISCSAPLTSDYLVLKGATVFDGTGEMIEEATIIIKDDVIEGIGDNTMEIPENAEVMNLSGQFITPGLVDAHIHFFQTAFFDSRPDALDLRDTVPYENVVAYQAANPDRYFDAYLKSGVTAVYDVGSLTSTIALQDLLEGNANAPHVAASGPLITPAPPSFLASFNTADDTIMVHLDTEETARRLVQRNTALGSTGIKLWALAPVDLEDMSKLNALSEAILESGNQLIVHATKREAAAAAIELGAKLLVHSVTEDAIDDDFINLMLDNDVIMTPTLVVSGGYLKAYRAVLGEAFEINDPFGAVDKDTRGLLESAEVFRRFVDEVAIRRRIERFEAFIEREDSLMASNLKRLYAAGALLAVGTDAGNPGTLHGISIYDEMEAMQATGIDPADLIVMATRNGAMAMQRIDDIGTLVAGKQADLVVVSADPSEDIANMRTITHVMRAGQLQAVAAGK